MPRERKQWYSIPRLRLVFVVASLVIAAVAVFQLRTFDQVVYRAGPSDGIPVATPQVRDDGRVVLRWRYFRGADSYRVILFREDLSVLTTIEPISETKITLDADAVKDPTTQAVARYWQVVALERGDVIASSAPQRLLP